MFVYFCLIDMQIGGLGRIQPDRLQVRPDETFQHQITSCLKENLIEIQTGLISGDTYPHRFEARPDVGWFCWQFGLLCYRRP